MGRMDSSPPVTTSPPIHASDEAIELIRRHGGAVWAWPATHPCCGGPLTLLEAGFELPDGPFRFQRLQGNGFILYLDTGSRDAPDTVELVVRGWRNKHIEVYWDGCAYVM